MDIKRPNPDQLLKSMEAAEEKKKTGKLRIFFGYAAGIGKTYSMLRSARKRKEEGVDVVIGYLEPHDRPETIALSEGLEQIPVKRIRYHNMLLKEMDVDAILARKPTLVLVDEYAHTNVPGSRHEKRYQDVEELLAGGIDVYTTVNVQHIESLCDIVASITGIFVRERIPDSAFDRADEIKLVDAEPGILMNRLAQGKVYRSHQAGRALHHFFTVEKLTALRELALRRTADRVNLLTEQTKKETGGQYYTEEKILVGISPSPSNPKIIRTAARMAKAFGGMMIGLYVETPDSKGLSQENKKRLRQNMQLAERLGARIETVFGEDIPFLIAEYAKNAGISKIIAGRSIPPRGFFKRLTFVDKLIMYAPDIDIYIIPDSHHRKEFHLKETFDRPREALQKTGVCLGIFAILGFLFFQHVITITELVFLLIFFGSLLMMGNLVLKTKRQSRELVKSAYRTKIILEITQILQQQTEPEKIGPTMAKELGKLLNRTIVYYDVYKEKLGPPFFIPKEGDAEGNQEMTEKHPLLQENEKAVAQWVCKNLKSAGATTDTLHNAAGYYLPIYNRQQIYGVVGIGISSGEELSTLEQNVVSAIVYETATVMERERVFS